MLNLSLESRLLLGSFLLGEELVKLVDTQRFPLQAGKTLALFPVKGQLCARLSDVWHAVLQFMHQERGGGSRYK